MAIDIDIGRQELTLVKEGLHYKWPVSTAAKGTGQLMDSYQTPLGNHIIHACIGTGLPSYAVFESREFTGEVWTSTLHERFPGRDWILGRILWLEGTEENFNKSGNVDTKSRYIYIHGTPDSEPMGTPASHGCIRMRCDDLLQLFSLAESGMSVNIHT